MFPIFIFTGMGSEPQNAFLPPCGCFRRKQKQQMPLSLIHIRRRQRQMCIRDREAKTADAVCRSGLACKKRIPENPQIFRNSNIKIMFLLNMARVQRRPFETYG